MYKKYVKRILDIILSLFSFIMLLPIIVLISIWIKLSSKGPIFFLQERLGKSGKIFKIIKFRTMIVNAENIGDGLHVKDNYDARITSFGKILRQTSLDELPQLINVIKGEMSLIGPRPPVTYYPYKYKDYTDEQRERFSVRPGITGLAQVRVRNNASWEERIKIDLEYIENISFINDIKIIFKTIVCILKKKNIYSSKNKIDELSKKTLVNRK